MTSKTKTVEMMLAPDFALLDVRRFSSSHADAEININKMMELFRKGARDSCRLQVVSNLGEKQYSGQKTRGS